MIVQPLDTGLLKFYLHFQSNEDVKLEIDEPIQWNEIEIKIEQETYARHLSFGNDSVSLQFIPQTHELGHQFERLIDYHKNYGYESKVDLIIEIDNLEWFRAELQFESVETNRDNYFNVDCEIFTLRKEIERKEDLTVDLLADKTLDEEEIEPIHLSNVVLRPKEILQSNSFELTDSQNESAEQLTSTEVHNVFGAGFFLFYPFGQSNTQEIEGTQNYSYFIEESGEMNFLFNNSGSIFSQPTQSTITAWKNNNLFNFKFTEPTNFSMNFNEFMASFSVNSSSLNTGIAIRLGVVEWEEGFENVINSKYELLFNREFTNSVNGLTNESVDYSEILPANTTITFEVVFYRVGADGVEGDYFRINQNTINFNVVEIYPQSNAKMTRLIDAGKKVLENYSNGTAQVSAPLFTELNSPFYEYFITSGFFIRGFEGKKLNLKWKDWKEFIESQNCDVQINGNNVFIGRQEDFFKNTEVGRFEFNPNQDDFKIIYDDSRLINQINLAFDTYESDDNSNTLDAFHTETEWHMPNKKIKDEKSIDVNFISEQYSIEYTRREGFEEEPTTAKDEDDDIHIIDTIQKEFLSFLIRTNRSDEGFEFFNNSLFSPSTSYNVRLSPKRILLDHWKHFIAECGLFLNNGIQTNETEYLNNTYFKNNGDLETSSTLPFTFNPRIKENESVIKEQIALPLIRPEVYEFTLGRRLKYNEQRELYDSIINDKGFITFFTDDTEIKLFPKEVSYNQNQEKLTIKGNLKYDLE